MIDVSIIRKKVHILLNRNELKELREVHRREARIAAGKSIETFRSINLRAKRLFDRIHANFDLKKDMVQNIITYCKCLPRPGTTLIDKNVFEAQLKRHFHLTNDYMLNRLWQIICLGEHDCQLSCFVELIAIFLCSINDYKVQLVFKVYNFMDDGYISRKDIEYFIRPMMINISLSNNEETSDEHYVKDFVEMLLSVVDLNGDEKLELDEFRHLAKHNVLMMECLGPCLPVERDRKLFMRLLTDKTPTETMALFRFERKISLQSAPEIKENQGIQKYYPIPLEIP